MRKRTGYLIQRGYVYYAVWNVSGKRFMRSTGKRDRREAEQELRRIMEPFAVGDEITVLGNISARIEGRSAELARIDKERNPPLAVATAWRAYLTASSRPDSGPRTLADYEAQFAQFATWLKQAHPEISALIEVTPAVAGEYAECLSRERHLSANSFNKHVRLLELVFRVLRQPGRLDANPWKEVQRKRVVTESRRELTTDELRTVCGALAGEMRALFAMGIYTGLRLGDAATLRWSEVDLSRRIIRRIPRKTSRRNPRPVVIPVHPTLAAILSEVAGDDRSEFVLPETAALYMKDAPALSNRIQRHFANCGIRTLKPGTGSGSKKRGVVEVGFHSLRHSFVSLCREANAPLAVVEAIVGHSSPAMTRHYTHVSELAAAHAVNGLPAVIGDAQIALSSGDLRAELREAVRELTAKLTAKNWREVKVALGALAEKA